MSVLLRYAPTRAPAGRSAAERCRAAPQGELNRLWRRRKVLRPACIDRHSGLIPPLYGRPLRFCRARYR